MAQGPSATTSPSGVATIALDQPETRNALSDEVLDDLLAAFTDARDDDAVRCVVLASTHETTFSSGGNLAGFAADVPLIHKHLETTTKFPRAVHAHRRARKAGGVRRPRALLAGALGLALACDLVIASEEATFGTPEINVGVFPFMIMALIFRNVPRKKGGRAAVARRAHRRTRGGAHRDRQPGRARRGVRRRGGATGPAAGAEVARAHAHGQGRDVPRAGHGLADALDFLRAQLTIAFSTEDIQEGVQAFFDKREPVWKGR